ncbi:MAG TPA: AAA family ATPase [Myxococcaceae bacterium]|jgi:predicted AAA+ superfamily ATPase|nr:AAA family ATPase [Myxococcaceae bacterium]
MPAPRYLRPQILRDLARKMVFLSGPRQVGKTTLALSLPDARRGYLNWDVAAHRERILRRELPVGRLWIFDELHKYRGWRNWLKGVYDGRPGGQRLMVTGSARLEFYRYSGDSLQGRYHLLRLHPLSVAELDVKQQSELRDLLRLGGFPEPFFAGSAVEARRWSREYRNLLIREELTSLERVDDLGRLELLVLRLPELVGSLLSVNALREDLDVSHKTVERWIGMLERLFAVFRLPPLGAPRIRAIRKARKHYHFDWSLVEDGAARFENLVASHLLKWVHHEQDTRGRDLELRYFRDTDGRDVDFVVVDRRTPKLLVECQTSDGRLDPALRYLKSRFPEAAAWQIAAEGRRDYQTPEGIRVAPALTFLRTLV